LLVASVPKPIVIHLTPILADDDSKTHRTYFVRIAAKKVFALSHLIKSFWINLPKTLQVLDHREAITIYWIGLGWMELMEVE